MSAASSTQTRFRISVASGGAVVDLAAILSRHNQRLYRQGRVYGVTVSSIPTWGGATAPSPATMIQTAPNNWLVRKAWGLAFKKWRESTQEERSNGVRAGRWNDFRVKYDVADNPTNYVKSAFGAGPLANGEVNYTLAASDITGSTDRTLAMFGNTDPNNWGVLDEYNRLADTDQDTPPTSSSVMPYSDMMQSLDDSQANAIQEEGDSPPYDAVTLGNNIHRSTYYVGNSDAVNRSSGLILAPCGLLQIYNTGAEAAHYVLDFKSGKYKGVHAEAMA